MIRQKSHSFDVQEATIHGVQKAIILANFRYWLDKNAANGTNFKDGYYWTFNTSEALAKLLPYFPASSIRRWLSELEADGVLKSGNYNRTPFDKTKWYTIPSEYSIDQNDQCTLIKMESSIDQNDQPIPNINTEVNSDVNTPPPISPSDQARDGVVYESRQDRWKPSPEMTKNLMSAICDRYGYSQPDMAAFNSILIEKHYQSIPDENLEILCAYLKEFDWKDKEKSRYVTNFSPASDFRQNFDKLIAKACSEYEAPLSPEMQEMVRKARGW